MATSIDTNPRLRANIRDESNKMLQPISGYEDELLVSFEEACKPLEEIIDKELQQNMMIAKMNSEEPKDGLSQDESASIHLYTMEWKIHENSFYAVLNRTLRFPDRRKLQPWYRYLKLFLTAFFKLPPSEHRTVWRGVPEDLSDLYPNGKKVTWWGISSCSSSISVLQSSYYAGNSGPRTMFSIETNSGKLIRSHSYFEQEDEILLPPGIHLQVIDKFSSPDGLTIIHLREIAPPYKTLADPFDLSQWKPALLMSTSSSIEPKPLPTQENVPKLNDVPKMPTKEEILPVKNVVSKPEPENVPTANVESKTSVQGSSNENESQPIASKSDSSSPRKELDCKGRACDQCGYCRDWYYRSGLIYGKNYKKRAGATCSYTRYDRRFCVDTILDLDRFDDDLYNYWHYGSGPRIGLCECLSNRS